MLKINSKGFVLVETLVVAVFVSAIFSVIYSNFYPIMGEYEKREAYDDIDSKYATFWFKRIIQSDSVNFTNIQNDITNNSYHEFNCSNDIVDSDVTAIKVCNSLVTRFGVEKMYITDYKLGNRDVSSDKNNFKDIAKISIEELNRLPKYIQLIQRTQKQRWSIKRTPNKTKPKEETNEKQYQ